MSRFNQDKKHMMPTFTYPPQAESGWVLAWQGLVTVLAVMLLGLITYMVMAALF